MEHEMTDRLISIAELKKLVASFVKERDWQQFHAPKNLAMSIAIEAAELMELFQWSDEVNVDEKKLFRVKEELSDVVIYCLSMANALEIDLTQAVQEKVAANAQKYPVEKFKGKYSTD